MCRRSSWHANILIKTHAPPPTLTFTGLACLPTIGGSSRRLLRPSAAIVGAPLPHLVAATHLYDPAASPTMGVGNRKSSRRNAVVAPSLDHLVLSLSVANNPTEQSLDPRRPTQSRHTTSFLVGNLYSLYYYVSSKVVSNLQFCKVLTKNLLLLKSYLLCSDVLECYLDSD
jgi:hypothetical protein